MGQQASKSHALPKAARAVLSKPTKNKISLHKRVEHPQNTAPRATPTKENKNTGQIGQIRVEEIPLNLDQNHAALRTLRNRTELESLLKAAQDSPEAVQSSVHPNTFVAIVEDLNHYSQEEVRRRYNLSGEFVSALRAVRMQTTKQRVEEKEKKIDQKARELQAQKDLDRMNGVAGRGNVELESALEDLLGGHSKH